MMRKQLPKEWIDRLLGMPESGMGYQRVDIFFTDGSTEHDCVVFNAEEAEMPDVSAGKTIVAVKLHESEHPPTS